MTLEAKWELVPVTHCTLGQYGWLRIPDPCLPEEWLQMSYRDQLVILMKTMKDIVDGIWETEITPNLHKAWGPI